MIGRKIILQEISREAPLLMARPVVLSGQAGFTS
jgi:hypothetical protein